MSGAVTLHFLTGAAVVANLPRIYRRVGVPATTATGAVLLALGVRLVAGASAMAAVRRGAGQRQRLGGAGSGGRQRADRAVVRAPASGRAEHGVQRRQPGRRAVLALVGLPDRPGRLSPAALWVGLIMVTLIAALSRWVFTATPQSLGQHPDGEAVAASTSAAPACRTRAQPAARPRLSEPGRRHGAGACRADRPDRPSAVRAGALAGRADRRHRDGTGHRRRHRGPHAGGLADAGRRRPARGGLRGLWRAALRLAGAGAGAGPDLGRVAGRAAVRLRHRQRHLAAAAHRADRVFTRGRAARGAPDHGALASRLCLRAGAVRPAARAAGTGRAAAVALRGRRRAAAGGRDRQPGLGPGRGARATPRNRPRDSHAKWPEPSRRHARM